MKRRSFFLTAGLGLSGAVITSELTACTAAPTREGASTENILPARLLPGDTVGLITPGSPLNADAYDKVFENIKALGFKYKTSSNFNRKEGFIAGTDEERLADLHVMFADPEIKAIVCGRGGYGTGRLLEKLDYSLIKNNPKIIIGFSDITALLNAIYLKTGLVCFHGPVAASVFSDFTTRSFQDVLMKGENQVTYQNKELFTATDPAYTPLVIKAGKASGVLVGGNLSILVSLLGTPYFPDLKGSILFMEEIGEYPYRIDRMLTQLLNAKVLEEVSGIAIGIFSGCKDTGEKETESSLEVISERLESMKVPIIYGLPFGHVDHNATLPIGGRATLDTSTRSLTIEGAVVQ